MIQNDCFAGVVLCPEIFIGCHKLVCECTEKFVDPEGGTCLIVSATT